MTTRTTPFFPAAFFSAMLLFSTPAFASGTIGAVTAVQVERGLIEIDGAAYSLTAEAMQNAANLADFKRGLIVEYTASDGRITAITLLKHLREIPQ